MVALIVGIVLFAFAIAACVPGLIGWGDEVLAFLKGAIPVISAFIALIAVFIGLADIKDRREAKKEEEAEKKPDAKA